jgi:excisionase family DNA binding protein
MTSHNSDRAEDSPASIALSHGNDAGSVRLPPRAFSIREFCRRYGIGRTNAYQEIATGRLRAAKVGRRTLITHDAAEAWLAALPEIKQSNRSLTERRKKQS